MNSKETGKGKFGMRRTAIALAVAAAFGLGVNGAFAGAPTITAAKIQKNDGSGTNKVAVIFDQGVYSASNSRALPGFHTVVEG